MPIIPTARLAALMNETLRSASLALASRTWQRYTPAWVQWQEFCREHGCTSPYHGSPHIAAAFLTQVRLAAAERGIGPQAVEVASSSISAHYRAVGMPSPCQHLLCHNVVEVARRTLQPQRLDRPEATAADMAALVAAHIRPGCNLGDRMHVTTAVLCMAGIMRFDDATKIMVHHDLMRFYPAATGQLGRVELHLYKRKNDPRATGSWVTIGATGGPTCPVALLQALLAEGGYKRRPEQRPKLGAQPAAVAAVSEDAEDVGPLLRPVKREGGRQVLRQVTAPLEQPIEPLSYGRFRAALADLFEAAGLDKRMGGQIHSLRIGGATAAVNAGVDRTLVQKAGGWRSTETFEAVYARDGPAQRATVARGILQAPL